MSILAVDDDGEVLAVTKAALEAEGYRVFTASNGRAALAMLDMHPEIALLFTDIVMPGSFDGFDLAAAAKRRHPKLRVVYTSGYVRNDGGLDGVLLRKPWTADELARVIADVLPAGRS